MFGLGDLFGDDDGGDKVGEVHKTKTGGDSNVPKPPRLPNGLCGIYNQGATCYMNSLLQTLLMTPELREGLFSLGENELGKLECRNIRGSKVRVIPIQLQRLFANLLLLDQQGASTTELTDSFGWTNHEEFIQHDVQELNRILFSAMEESLVGTSGHQLIRNLYHGTLVNQITCQTCGRISERPEDFLDLCVAVADSSGLEASLADNYIGVEMLDGKNQYRCEACNKLVDAKKGTKIRNLPPVLTLSLLRFSFDFVKLERYKETGKFTFPLEIDMNPFLEKPLSLPNQDTSYELFSVVIHRGSGYGGHYHAYIRDVDNLGKWTHPDQEEIVLPLDPLTGKVDYLECDSPIELIQALLHRTGNQGMQVDKLCAELTKQTGITWNKRFRRSYGPINKFLKKYDDKFVVQDAGNIVWAKDYGTSTSNETSASDKNTKNEQNADNMSETPESSNSADDKQKVKKKKVPTAALR